MVVIIVIILVIFWVEKGELKMSYVVVRMVKYKLG